MLRHSCSLKVWSGLQAPSTNDILASMDDSNLGAVDATRANQATLEKMAAHK